MKQEQTLTEQEQLIRISAGDRKAFEVLYKQHLSGLYRYIYLFAKSKEQTEDIVQNVFAKIWQKRESLADVNSFKAYLYQSAKNLLLDEIRKSQAEAKKQEVIKLVREETSRDSDYNLLYKDYYKMAWHAINMLPEKRKRIVELRIKDDLDLDEIASELHLSKPAVKKQLYTGLKFVKDYLNKYCGLTAVYLLSVTFFG